MADQDNWVDYKAIKAAVSIEKVIDHYALSLRKSGKAGELAGACPIHKQDATDKRRPFTVNVTKNIFQCFKPECAKGNQIDLVAKLEGCTFRDAALKLKNWFPAEYAAARATIGQSAPETPAPASAETKEQGSGQSELLITLDRIIGELQELRQRCAERAAVHS
jgi:hypothetical protein